MVLIILEAENNLINSIIPKFTQKINKECIKVIPNKVQQDELTIYEKPPLLELGWLLIYSGKDEKVIKKICTNKNNVIILLVHSRTHKEFVESVLNSFNIDYKFVDNMSISREEKIKYVKENLNIGDSLAVYLVNRTRGSVKDIVKAVETLRHADEINRQLIRSLVPKIKQYSINDLYLYLVCDSVVKPFGAEMSYQDAVQIIYDYKFGFEYLRNFLIERLQRDLYIYELIETSGLSLANYKSYKSNIATCNDKILTAMTEYQLYKVIERHRKISSEYLYFLLFSIQKLENSYDGIVTLMNIIKLREEKKYV